MTDTPTPTFDGRAVINGERVSARYVRKIIKG